MTSPLLVFDLDGTLAETAGDLIAALNFVLGEQGLSPVSPKEARHMVGMGGRSLIRSGLASNGKSLPDETVEKMFRDYIAYYEAHIAVHTALFPGVVASLDRFEAAGYGFAVCTNKMAHASLQLLTALGVAGRFRAICGQDTFAWSKPDARALLSTIDRAGGDPRRTVMIGDSRTDIATAQAAQVPVVAVDFGYTDVPVRDLAPDRVISHFDELWDAARAIMRP